MDIKGLDYNTKREKLVLPEYGREIQKMVDHAIGLPTKEERLRCAYTIIRQMENKVPQLKSNAGYEQTLWDHLYLMSHKALDIDWPYDVSEAEKILSKPTPVSLPKSAMKLRHYGSLVEKLLEQLATMPAGEERDRLACLTANQMKRDLTTWGHGTMDDERVVSDLARLTQGVIQLDLNTFKFEKVTADPVARKTKKKK